MALHKCICLNPPSWIAQPNHGPSNCYWFHNYFYRDCTVWGIHVTKWLSTRSFFLFLAPLQVGFFRILYSYRMEFVQIKHRVRGKSSSSWWCKRYNSSWCNSREHSKNVFAINLGHRDKVHDIGRKIFSECSRESDQIAE